MGNILLSCNTDILGSLVPPRETELIEENDVISLHDGKITCIKKISKIIEMKNEIWESWGWWFIDDTIEDIEESNEKNNFTIFNRVSLGYTGIKQIK